MNRFYPWFRLDALNGFIIPAIGVFFILTLLYSFNDKEYCLRFSENGAGSINFGSMNFTCMSRRQNGSNPVSRSQQGHFGVSKKQAEILRRILKRLSLAKSVVGRTGIFAGGWSCFPLNLPLIIRTVRC